MLPGVAALASHFSQMTTAGDEQQRVPKTKHEPPLLPAADPQDGIVTAGVNMIHVDAAVFTWLHGNPTSVSLYRSARLGSKNIDLAEETDRPTRKDHFANAYTKTEIAYLAYYHQTNNTNGWGIGNISHPMIFLTVAR